MDNPSSQPIAPSFGIINSTGSLKAVFDLDAEPLQYVAISN